MQIINYGKDGLRAKRDRTSSVRVIKKTEQHAWFNLYYLVSSVIKIEVFELFSCGEMPTQLKNTMADSIYVFIKADW